MKNEIVHITLHITTGVSGDPCTVAIVRYGGTRVYNVNSAHRIGQLSRLLAIAGEHGYSLVEERDAGDWGGYLYYATEPFEQDENGDTYNGKWVDCDYAPNEPVFGGQVDESDNG